MLIILLAAKNTYPKENYKNINGSLFFGANLISVFGDLVDEERNLYEHNEITNKPGHDSIYAGLQFDYFPSTFNVNNKYLFGVRGNFATYYIFQESRISKNNNKHYMEKWIQYNYWMIGPIINILLVEQKSNPEKNKLEKAMFFSFFILYGQIINGEIKGVPVLRKAGYDYPDYKTNITGQKINIGMGFLFKLGYINFGLNAVYSRLWLKMDRVPEIYS